MAGATGMAGRVWSGYSALYSKDRLGGDTHEGTSLMLFLAAHISAVRTAEHGSVDFEYE